MLAKRLILVTCVILNGYVSNQPTLNGQIDKPVLTPEIAKPDNRPIYALKSTISPLSGNVEHIMGWLGMTVDYDTGLIKKIFPDSNVNKTVIKVGDYMIKINGKSSLHKNNLTPDRKAGDYELVTFIHNGHKLVLRIKLVVY